MQRRDIVDDFWDAADRNPPGHEAAAARFRALIHTTQQPSSCERRCRLNSAYHGGALADVRRLAYALMYAVTHNCALVTEWPHNRKTINESSLLTTSAELRSRCANENRKGFRCYFQPPSTCHQVNTPSPHAMEFDLDGGLFKLERCLDRINQLTGLRSELLIMGSLVSWIMRPQPELREAIQLYGRAAGFDGRGVRERNIAMHVRHGDKHSLYPKHMKNDSWRVSAQSFEAWGRRVAASIGAERTLYMTDDPQVMRSLEERSDGFFRLVPAGRACIPSYAAGMLGKHHIPAAVQLIRMHRDEITGKARRKIDAASAGCGPAYLADDGIQLFAGVYLLAQCGAFIGTQLSNIDAAVVELMATRRHPPIMFDVLNDVHRACLSDEKVWFGGSHAQRRPLDYERLAIGGGNTTSGRC